MKVCCSGALCSPYNKNKEGISLITLIITIIVIIILAAIVIFTGLRTPDSAQFSSFAQQVDNVQMAVNNKYADLKTKHAIAKEYRTDEQIYIEIARAVDPEQYASMGTTEVLNGTNSIATGSTGIQNIMATRSNLAEGAAVEGETKTATGSLGMELPKVRENNTAWYVTKEGRVFNANGFAYSGKTYFDAKMYKDGELGSNDKTNAGRALAVYDAMNKNTVVVTGAPEDGSATVIELDPDSIGAKLNIGDWVEYVSTYTGTGFETGSGKTYDVGTEQTVQPDKTTKWRVWDRKANGDIVITPCYKTEPAANTKLTLGRSHKGKDPEAVKGYLNGPAAIEAACETLYVNNQLNPISIRSMRASDIEERLAWDYKSFDGYGTKYGPYTTGTFYAYLEDDDVTKNNIDSVAAITSSSSPKRLPITLKNTYYGKSLSAADWNKYNGTDNYGELLGTQYEWLASSCVHADSSVASFVVRVFSSSTVGICTCWASWGYSGAPACALRPLVTLSSTLKVNEGAGTETSPYTLKP